MPWQNVLVSKPTRLSIENNNLKVLQQDLELILPLDDVATLTLESPQILLTMPVLAACAERGIALVVCDGKHLPCGLMLPLGQHSKSGAVAIKQNEWSKTFRDELWTKLITAKIAAQRDLLGSLGIKSARLERLANHVNPDNASDYEAQAARNYWPLLFGEDFKRQEISSLSFALDYAYAIVRASVARAITAYGFHPALGLHHKHPQNAFNLADDLIEPFRPFVDWWVRGDGSLDQSCTELTVAQRARLTQSLQVECLLGGKSYSVQTAIDRMVQSLVSATTDGNSALFRTPSAPTIWRLTEKLPDG